MQRLQHLFTESGAQGGGGEKLLPLEATAAAAAAKTKLSLNGIRQPLQKATPVSQTIKQIKHYPSTGKAISKGI
jgi:hypothetical protein